MGGKSVSRMEASRKVEVPVLDPGGAFKDYCALYKVQPFSSTNLESMDACLLNYWPGLLKAWLALTSVKYHGNL